MDKSKYSRIPKQIDFICLCLPLRTPSGSYWDRLHRGGGFRTDGRSMEVKLEISGGTCPQVPNYQANGEGATSHLEKIRNNGGNFHEDHGSEGNEIFEFKTPIPG